MAELVNLIFDGNGYLGVSNDFWINVISELFVGVLIVGSISILLARYNRIMEDRMRRYERSSQALRLQQYYGSALLAWSSCVERFGPAVAHIIGKKGQPFDHVLDAQMASANASIEQIESARRNIREWFEDNYGVYPVEKQKAIHAFQEVAEEFCNAMGTYVLVFGRILSADRDLIKLGGMFVETDDLIKGFENFENAVTHYADCHAKTFGSFLLNSSPNDKSVAEILNLKEKHLNFSSLITSFANHVTSNYRKSVSAAGLSNASEKQK